MSNYDQLFLIKNLGDVKVENYYKIVSNFGFSNSDP